MVTQAGELWLMSTGKRADNRHRLQRAIPSQHLENLGIPLNQLFPVYHDVCESQTFWLSVLICFGGYKTSLHGVILLKCCKTET